MKRIFNILMLAGVVLLSYSCAETAEPTAAQMTPGNWIVREVYVNGQTQDDVSLFARFIVERDGSFVLEDVNGIFFAGEWTSTEDNLTMSASDGTVFDFVIVYQSYSKMQLVQTLSGTAGGDLEIRYLLDKSGNNSTYGSDTGT